MQSNLTDKVILVTGASQGIGRAVSLALCMQGAKVIALSRRVTALEALYDEVQANGGCPPCLHPFNLTSASAEDYDDLRRHIDKYFAKLDGLVHIATALGSITPIEYFEIQTWYEVLQTNLNSCFMLTRALIPQLKKPTKASILFTLHPQAHKSTAFWGAYAVANQGLKAFSEVLTDELENTSIHVNTITPPPTDTQFRHRIYPADLSTPLFQPDEVAKLYLEKLSVHFQDAKTIV